MSLILRDKARAIDDNECWNVEYYDAVGDLALRFGCDDEGDARELAERINDSCWLEIRGKLAAD